MSRAHGTLLTLVLLIWWDDISNGLFSKIHPTSIMTNIETELYKVYSFCDADAEYESRQSVQYKIYLKFYKAGIQFWV